MPTEYSNCDECSNLDYLEKIKPGINSIYRKHQKISECLNLPQEIREIIMKYANNTTICSNCGDTKLCSDHLIIAQNNHQYYRNCQGIMCDKCCWENVS